MVSGDNSPKKEIGFMEQAFRATNSGGPMFIVLLVFIPFIILVQFVRASPTPFGIAALVCAVLGFALFSSAKVSLYRQGHWFTFGSSLMTSRNRLLYRLGYVLMFCSVIISLVLLIIGRMRIH